MNLVAYLASPLNAPTPEGIAENRRRAAEWGAWLVRTFRIAVSADYLWLSTQWTETPENRALGLEADKAQIARCDFLTLAGGRVSTGMGIERAFAGSIEKPMLDITEWGASVPTGAELRSLEMVVAHWLDTNFPGRKRADDLRVWDATFAAAFVRSVEVGHGFELGAIRARETADGAVRSLRALRQAEGARVGFELPAGVEA